LWDMEDASVYERAVVDPVSTQTLGAILCAIDLKTAGQSFRREVTAELIRALSSTGEVGLLHGTRESSLG